VHRNFMEVDIFARPKRNESDHIRKSKWKLIPLPPIGVIAEFVPNRTLRTQA
jgi:hypothetical protein